MTIINYGIIRANKNNNFCVNSLIINMGINMQNNSKILNFSVKTNLLIETCYNGLIHGIIERECKYVKPNDIIMGRAAILKINRHTVEDQMILNKYRKSLKYKKSVFHFHKNIDTDTNMCICGKNKINTLFDECGHTILCIKCVFNKCNAEMISPYFKCSECSENVTDIKEYYLKNNIITFT
jgi:hypothetical protein